MWSILTILAVCSAGTASPLAEETDAGETGYFSTSCGQLQSSPGMLHLNVKRLHVSHADVLVSQPCGRPVVLFPDASPPQRMHFGMRPAS